MRPTAVLPLCALALVAARPAAAQFEGVVTTRVTGEKGKTMLMEQMMKGPRIRTNLLDPQAKGAYTIIDGQAGTMTSVMPEQKMYMVMDAKKSAEELEGMRGEKEDREVRFPKVEKTSRKETIAGHPCTHYIMTPDEEHPEKTVDMCVAKGLGYFGMQGGGRQPGPFGGMRMADLGRYARLQAELAKHPDFKEMLEGGAYPLKMEGMEKGKPTFAMEVQKIEKKSLADADFQPPAGFQEMKMPSLGEMMKGFKRPGK